MFPIDIKHSSDFGIMGRIERISSIIHQAIALFFILQIISCAQGEALNLCTNIRPLLQISRTLSSNLETLIATNLDTLAEIKKTHLKIMETTAAHGSANIESIVANSRTKGHNYMKCLKVGKDFIVASNDTTRLEIEECFETEIGNFENKLISPRLASKNLLTKLDAFQIHTECLNISKSFADVCDDWIVPFATKKVNKFNTTIDELTKNIDGILLPFKKTTTNCCRNALNVLSQSINNAQNKTETCINKKKNKAKESTN